MVAPLAKSWRRPRIARCRNDVCRVLLLRRITGSPKLGRYQDFHITAVLGNRLIRWLSADVLMTAHLQAQQHLRRVLGLGRRASVLNPHATQFGR